MPLVKYVSNISYTDGTGAISFGPERVLTIGGAPLEVTDAELSYLRSKFVVEVLNVPDVPNEEPVSDLSPVVPAVVAPSTVSVGSTPSSPVSNQSSPTPPEGN